MRPHQIEQAIRDTLDGDAHEYARGMDAKTWGECVAMVQRGEHTIEAVATLITTWAAATPEGGDLCKG